MTDWAFDQPRNVACITSRAVLDGQPVLAVAHYEDDHSWAFLDGTSADMAAALVVAMSEVVDRHPDLHDIADLPPGLSAQRAAAGQLWLKQQDD